MNCLNLIDYGTVSARIANPCKLLVVFLISAVTTYLLLWLFDIQCCTYWILSISLCCISLIGVLGHLQNQKNISTEHGPKTATSNDNLIECQCKCVDA